MSDYNDPEIDMSVNVETDISGEMSALNALEEKARSVTEAFKQLGNTYQKVTKQQVTGVQDNGFSNSWDTLYNRELKSIQNEEKRNAFLKMLDSTVHENIKYAPASTTGQHHPGWANVEGGLIRHSKAVASGALALATEYGYQGNRDDLLIAALGHDTQKLGKSGKFYNPAHALEGAATLKAFGLSEAASYVESHMGTKETGARKGDPTPETQGQRILAEADWLISRKYAEDYVQFDTEGNIKDIDIKGIRKEAIQRKEAKEGKDGYLDILGSVEQQEKAKEKAAKEWERSWDSVGKDAKRLYNILLDIAKLGLGVIPIAGKVVETGSNALSAGDRTYNATTGDQVLGNRLAADIVGIGKNTINEELTALSAKRGSFSLLGEAGDLLPMALAKNLDELLLSDENVYNVYWRMLDSFVEQIEEAQGRGNEGRVKELMFLTEKSLGPGARKIADYSAENDIIPSSLTARVAPPGGLLGWQEQIDDVNRAFKIAVDGMKDSITGLSTHFMKEFGVPVATWFDKTLRRIITSESTRQEIEGRSRELNGLLGMRPSFDDEYDAEIAVRRKDILKQKTSIQEEKKTWESKQGKTLEKVWTGTPQTQVWRKMGFKPDTDEWYKLLYEQGFTPPKGLDFTELQTWARSQYDMQQESYKLQFNTVDEEVKAFDKAQEPKLKYSRDRQNYSNWKSIQWLGMQAGKDTNLGEFYTGLKEIYPEYTTGYQGLDPYIGDMIEMLIDQIIQGAVTPDRALEDVSKLKESKDVSVNINNTFPNATNAQEIKQGINESVDGIGRALETFNFG